MFTPYTPFLKDSGVSDAEVFLAYTILHMCKVVFLPFNHRIIALKGEEGMSKIAYIPRIMGIALAVMAAVLVLANPGSILMITLLAFVGTEVGFSMWSATTTSSLLKIIPAGQEGRILGINSAVIGAGLLIGSLAAGEVSAAFGYGATFALAIAVAIASFVLVSKFFKKVRVAPQVRA
jgi:DHA2 family lincomycin resistance protein-like MFS transporter